jgi:hypothetical protein
MARTRTQQDQDAGSVEAAQALPARAAERKGALIKNHESFQSVTGAQRGHQIAGLYFFQQLDCLIDLAHAVSCDFFRRPHLYIELDQSPPEPAPAEEQPTAEPDQPQSEPAAAEEQPQKNNRPRPALPLVFILAKLEAQLGHDEFFPSKVQRDKIYVPIFGRGGSYATAEEGDFPRLRDALLDAAAAFAERVFNTGEDMLLERVRTTHRPLAQYLRGLRGDSVLWSREFALPDLTEEYSYRILRSSSVSGIFGIQTAPTPDWPYIEDANGDKLVEAVSRQLSAADKPVEMPISRERISNLQRAALRGAEAIATIIDFQESPPDPEPLKLLINKCYTWRAALLSVSPATTVASQPAGGTTLNGQVVGAMSTYSPASRGIT